MKKVVLALLLVAFVGSAFVDAPVTNPFRFSNDVPVTNPFRFSN